MSWVDRSRRGRRDRPGPDTGTPSADRAPEGRAIQSRTVPELEMEEFDVNGRAGRGNGRDGNGNGRNGNGNDNGYGTDSPRRPRAPGKTRLPFAGEAQLSSVVLLEADVVAVVSAEGRFVFVSASAERLLGHDVRTAIGCDAFQLFDDESAPLVRSAFDDLIARRRLSVSLELLAVRADGRELELELVAANHLDDPVGGVVVTVRDVTESQRTLLRTYEGDRRQDALLESLADGLVMVDAVGTIVRVNEAFEIMFRAPRIRILGRNLEDLIVESRERGLELFDDAGGTVEPEEHPVLVSLRRGRRVDGAVIGYRTVDSPAGWVRINAQPVHAADGSISGAVGSFSDITDSRRAAYALRQEEEFLRVLLDTLDEGIVACDAQGRMTIFNPAARRLHGLDDSVEPIGRLPASRMLLRPDGTAIEPEENPLLLAMSGERLRNVEIILVTSDGEQRKVSVNGQALVDEEGWKLGAVVAMHDVTEQKLNEERLADLAHHDPLTGLANRNLLADRMREAVEALRTEPEQAARRRGPAQAPDDTRAQPEHPGVAVYLLDLDNFKDINDEFGHDVGDDLLVAVARRLLAIVRPADTVARLGGDEFVVVCGVESGEEEMLRIAERISVALARPYRIDGRTLVAEASVGGVFVDDPDTDPSRLLSLADDAMYGVKWSRRRQRRPMTD